MEISRDVKVPPVNWLPEVPNLKKLGIFWTWFMVVSGSDQVHIWILMYSIEWNDIIDMLMNL